MDLENVFVSLREYWFVKAVAGVVITVVGFLLGNLDAAFLALWVLVFIDTLTKWVAISRQTLIEQQSSEGLFCGFILAWHTGTLNSHAMRVGFTSKVFAYFNTVL